MNLATRIWESLRSSFWFIPSLLTFGAVLLAFALIGVDTLLGKSMLRHWPLLFGAGAEGSRGVLAAIAGSMITVAGVTFSITVVALSLTASQYSSRVLRNFIRDRVNQTVLGVFVAVFAYCLIVLRSIRGGEQDVFVPDIAVLVGVVLALVAIAVLIYFIHHIATSIQAVSIIAAATRETLHAIDHLFPADLGKEAEAAHPPDHRDLPPGTIWHPIVARRSGYLQDVDPDAILDFARKRETVVRMERAIGEFVVEGTPLASIAASSPPDDGTTRDLNRAYSLNLQRSVYQDASFGIQQIVDIALKGLSPGVNDTTTAIICIDHLSAILARAATRRIESPFRRDDQQVRVVSRGPTFGTLLSDALDQVRRSAAQNTSALLRLFDAIGTVASVTQHPGRRQALMEHVQLLWEVADRTIDAPCDRRLLEDRRDLTLRALREE